MHEKFFQSCELKTMWIDVRIRQMFPVYLYYTFVFTRSIWHSPQLPDPTHHQVTALLLSLPELCSFLYPDVTKSQSLTWTIRCSDTKYTWMTLCLIMVFVIVNLCLVEKSSNKDISGSAQFLLITTSQVSPKKSNVELSWCCACLFLKWMWNVLFNMNLINCIVVCLLLCFETLRISAAEITAKWNFIS